MAIAVDYSRVLCCKTFLSTTFMQSSHTLCGLFFGNLEQEGRGSYLGTFFSYRVGPLSSSRVQYFIR